MAKYEFTSKKMVQGDILLHRIRRLSDGEIGGWIEKESNLSQEGEAWVGDDARVYGNAEVGGDAQVFNGAVVFGNTCVSEYARVFGNAKVAGNAGVFGDAWVDGNAEVFGRWLGILKR